MVHIYICDIMTCGIYLIINKITKQKYVGQSINIERRWYYHSHGYSKSSYVDRAIKKYGVDNFILQIIEELPDDVEYLNQREQYWINYYNTYSDNRHYNLTPGGDFNPMKVPEIVKKTMVGKNNPSYGGLSLEHRKKISNALSGENNPMYGVHRYGKDNPMYDVHRYGKDNPNHKYSLWNTKCCYYAKNKMYNSNRQPNPCKCFEYKYNGYRLPIGLFQDFISCEIINNMVKQILGD